MKKILDLVIVTVFILQCTCGSQYYYYRNYNKTHPIVISERVGEAIDFEEREQLDLFAGITDFKTATFYGIENGGYEVEIITEEEKLVAVNRDPMAIKILRDYIDRYEANEYFRKEFEEEWVIVAYDDLGFPITQDEVNSTKSLGGGCLKGGVAGCFIGLFPSAIVGIGAADATEGHGEHKIMGALVGFSAGLIASGIIGALIGMQMEGSTALKAIKESRQPKVVE